LYEELESGVTIVTVGKGSDHGVVTDGVTNGQGGGVEELVSEFDVASSGVGGKQGGSCDDIWFGKFVEQVAGVRDVGGFAVTVDETVDDEREWLEA